MSDPNFMISQLNLSFLFLFDMFTRDWHRSRLQVYMELYLFSTFSLPDVFYQDVDRCVSETVIDGPTEITKMEPQALVSVGCKEAPHNVSNKKSQNGVGRTPARIAWCSQLDQLVLFGLNGHLSFFTPF